MYIRVRARVRAKATVPTRRPTTVAPKASRRFSASARRRRRRARQARRERDQRPHQPDRRTGSDQQAGAVEPPLHRELVAGQARSVAFARSAVGRGGDLGQRLGGDRARGAVGVGAACCGSAIACVVSSPRSKWRARTRRRHTRRRSGRARARRAAGRATAAISTGTCSAVAISARASPRSIAAHQGSPPRRALQLAPANAERAAPRAHDRDRRPRAAAGLVSRPPCRPGAPKASEPCAAAVARRPRCR